MRDSKLSIFSKARIKFNELYDDSLSYIKTIYGEVGSYFSNASPFGQLLRVTLHLGRLILTYIEDSITELNINTASRERSVKGLATLTGHNPSRGLGARGSITLAYNNSGEHINRILSIPNYSIIINETSGLKYTLLAPNDNIKLIISNSSNPINVSIVQGEIKYLQGTGSGYPLHSVNFNVNNNSNEIVDDIFTNVYVNGEKWRQVESILDMTYQEKACIIKTSQTSGVDVFFGNGNMGAIPPAGSTILFEYLSTQGSAGNVKNINLDKCSWKFENEGYLDTGESVDLNKLLNIKVENEILFGHEAESIAMTRALAPHASRSFILANKSNYEYFLRKLNMFSVIDVIQGFNNINDIKVEYEYKNALNSYDEALKNYKTSLTDLGKNVKKDNKYELALKNAKIDLENKKRNYENSKLDDNTIYLFLIPELTQRLSDTDNYFTCNTNSFILSDDEKEGIIDMIKNSGQQLLTIDNKIIDPVMPKFAINCFIQMWEDFDINAVKSEIINKISDYLINNTRRDRIPVSDLIKIVEEINGVDSVTIVFDADKNNINIYGNNYGIDEYGDIILERELSGGFGERIMINDIIPLFRGDWYNKNGVYYSDQLNSLESGPVNISLRGISKKDSINSILRKNRN